MLEMGNRGEREGGRVGVGDRRGKGKRESSAFIFAFALRIVSTLFFLFVCLFFKCDGGYLSEGLFLFFFGGGLLRRTGGRGSARSGREGMGWDGMVGWGEVGLLGPSSFPFCLRTGGGIEGGDEGAWGGGWVEESAMLETQPALNAPSPSSSLTAPQGETPQEVAAPAHASARSLPGRRRWGETGADGWSTACPAAARPRRGGACRGCGP